MFESSGETTPPCGVPSVTTQEPLFQDTCFQPFVDHPPDHTIRHSLVEDRAQVIVRDRVEVLAYVDIQHPVLSLPRDDAVEFAQRLMRRAARSEAIRARQEVLLVDG